MSLSFVVFLGQIILTTCVMTPQLRDKILADHNTYRKGIGATGMVELTYDDKLETIAQNYLNSFSLPKFEHNPNRKQDYANVGGSGSVGENWWSSVPDSAVFAWTERKDKNFPCPERQAYQKLCNGETGHYTQVTWASTQRVGCGHSDKWGTMCNYAPAGNFNNQNPYVIGTPCSECPKGFGTCVDGLCRSGSAPPPQPKVDCVGSFSAFGSCVGECGSPGTQTATYSISTQASNGGAACPNKNGDVKTQPCTPICPPVDCVGSWSPFNTCVGTCNSIGTQTSTYTISTPSRNGGKECPNKDKETKSQSCTPPCPDVDCVGNWEEGTCNSACGPGSKTLKYKITQPASGKGSQCSNKDGETKVETCQIKPCSTGVDCVGLWQWKVCNAKCGGGVSEGTYLVRKPASNGGAECPYKTGDRNPNPVKCNTNPCQLKDISEEFRQTGNNDPSRFWIALAVSVGCVSVLVSLIALYRVTKRYSAMQEVFEV